jgi:hypothetical protein
MNPRSVFVFLAALSLSATGCGGSGPGAVAVEPPLVLEKFAGDGAVAIAGGSVSPGVRVTRGGAAVVSARVRFGVRTGEGILLDTLLTTGIDGRVVAVWLLGPGEGAQTLVASVGETSVEFAATAMAPTPGARYLGRNEYVEYVPGELPVILSAPHGGSMNPAEIPDRASGTLVQDADTEDLARRIAAALQQRTGKRPHLVITHLHRRKVDTNREIVEAAQGNRFAERAWHEFHTWIETARQRVVRDHGRGFYVDVHGHGHEIQRLELGYMLSAQDLARPPAELNAPAVAQRSSIRTLGGRSDVPFSELLRGERSLGGILARGGYPAVPSPADPHPDGAPYFTGGYNTGRHGSRDGGPIDAVQLEANRRGVRDTAENREAFAQAFAAALVEFLEVNAVLSLAGAAAR